MKFKAKNVTQLLWATAYFVVGGQLVISSIVLTRKVLSK